MMDTLQRLADITVLAFVVLSMLAMGMSQRLAAVVSPLKDGRTVTAALVINFGIAPLLALALTRLDKPVLRPGDVAYEGLVWDARS